MYLQAGILLVPLQVGYAGAVPYCSQCLPCFMPHPAGSQRHLTILPPTLLRSTTPLSGASPYVWDPPPRGGWGGGRGEGVALEARQTVLSARC